MVEIEEREELDHELRLGVVVVVMGEKEKRCTK